jgi:hypothetical protein
VDSLEGPSGAPPQAWPRESVDSAWQSLGKAITWSVRSWWGYATGTPGSAELDALRRLAIDETGVDGIVLLQPTTPDELVDAARSIAALKYPSQKLIWLQPTSADDSLLLPPGDHLGRLINAISPHERGPAAPELREVGPWMRAWADAFAVLNVSRNLIRDRRTGGLVFVGPPSIRRIARTVAIDLASMNSVSVSV